MLTVKCINPQILASLSKLGHGDKILISDGNYPLASRSGNADKVYLALTAGSPTVTDVLAALQGVVNFEKAEVMTPGDGNAEPEIFGEFRSMLSLDLDKLGRYEFYEAAEEGPVKLAINTGEGRVFANIMLTIGVA